MNRHALIAAAAAFSILAAGPAFAGRQLAVGAAAGFEVPPGYETVPVYVWPNGTAWTPPDTSMGYVFREPVYSTPKGYRYVYVRGYYMRKIVDADAPRVRRVHLKKVRKAGKRHRGPCITDIGYGRHEYCNRY